MSSTTKTLPPLLQPHNGRLQGRSWKALIAFGALYLVSFLLTYRAIGNQAAVLSYVFVSGISWKYGARRGLVAVLFIWVLSALVFRDSSWPQVIFGLLSILLSALASGWVSYLYSKLKETEAELRVEHEKSEMILENIFPRRIVERLKQGEALIADRYLETTILFSDVVGFTQLTKTLDPHALVTLLDRLITGFDVLSERHGVEKIKTIGDAYLVVSGLPEENSRHASSILSMAKGMLQYIERFNEAEGTNLQIRVGVHSGSVIGGVIGPKKFTFDLWGDTVNLASRLESTGLPGRIQVSAVTYELTREEFEFEPRGILELKGHGPVQTYLLVD